MSDACGDLRLSLGAYAIGTLEPADEDAVETHLASCPTCLTELAELQSVIPALASLSTDDLTPPVPSPDLFDRIVSAVEPSEAMPSDTVVPLERARRPATRWMLAAAAAVVVLAGGGTAVGFAVANSSSHAAVKVADGRLGDVNLHVTATAVETGSRLELTAQGLAQHEHCHLVATAADGSSHPAGTWDASYEGKAKVTESTDVSPSQLRRLTLYGDGNKRLVIVKV